MIILGGLGFVGLLAYVAFYPLLKKPAPTSIQMHPQKESIQDIPIPAYKKIAVALEFGDADDLLLAHAIGQGQGNAEFVLIHVVESASARLLGHESDDYETRNDDARLQQYVQQLNNRGLQATAYLGFKHRAAEIVRLIKAANADMLVIGAHRHSGVKDWLYGETINSVRHDLTIPILVVNV
jgi:manganese transport protein